MRASADLHHLYGDHHPWLKAWLRRRLGNAADAADLAHDTFLRLLSSSRPSVELGREPRALLTHIAKGLVVDLWRRRNVERAYLEALAQLPPGEAPAEDTRLVILEALYRLDALLQSLSARTRAIFLRAQLDGVPYRQIAVEFGLSVPTVKRIMREAFAACLALA
jgi:RNA polymerase sigma-19 factor, ECF subfamily